MDSANSTARELLLLRHGKAAVGNDIKDFDRPLKDSGKRSVQRMGIWLLRQDLLPDCIITSPAERALTSAQKACKAMGLGSDGIIRDTRLYNAKCSEVLEVLAACPVDSRRVMLVGHNPALEQVIERLSLTSAQQDGPHLSAASLAVLQMPADWSSLEDGCANLSNLIHAEDLPKKFPYPSAHSSELRDRPAYYYTQSSVIPYRITDGQPEILIVRSSKMKHWVIPKGIKDPGHSPQASAAREAQEEAGVKGIVGNEIIGSYQCEKWGATCTVDVYPMAVTHVIPESEWEESHRGRQWVSVQQAARQLKQTELADMVIALAKKLA